MSQNKKRILVALYHSYFDTSSGAAISLRDMMEALARRGWEVRVLTGPRLDFENPKSNEELLRDQGIVFDMYRTSHDEQEIRLCLFRAGGVECAVWLPLDEQADPTELIKKAWLSDYRTILNSWKPDIMLTYGGFGLSRPMIDLAKQAGAKTMFLLCNFSYTNPLFFKGIDVTIVRSNYHASWCHDHLGLNGAPLYSLIPPSRYLCDREPGQQYVTFVNPQPHKGVYIFAKIAEILGKRRPDIPFLVVEGRATVNWLKKTGTNFASMSLYRLKNTPDPRDYLKSTRIMLVPSVWQESFGRVAAEAMMNGIPVVGSNRGALPEVIGDERFSLPIPDYITPSFRGSVPDNDVENWVQAIEKLWDDEKYYASISEQSIRQAENWSEDSIMASFETIAQFNGL